MLPTSGTTIDELNDQNATNREVPDAAVAADDAAAELVPPGEEAAVKTDVRYHFSFSFPITFRVKHQPPSIRSSST